MQHCCADKCKCGFIVALNNTLFLRKRESANLYDSLRIYGKISAFAEMTGIIYNNARRVTIIKQSSAYSGIGK